MPRPRLCLGQGPDPVPQGRDHRRLQALSGGQVEGPTFSRGPSRPSSTTRSTSAAAGAEQSFSFIVRYRSGFQGSARAGFDAPYARIDYFNDRFSVQWMRHTGRWWPLRDRPDAGRGDRLRPPPSPSSVRWMKRSGAPLRAPAACAWRPATAVSRAWKRLVPPRRGSPARLRPYDRDPAAVVCQPPRRHPGRGGSGRSRVDDRARPSRSRWRRVSPAPARPRTRGTRSRSYCLRVEGHRRPRQIPAAAVDNLVQSRMAGLRRSEQVAFVADLRRRQARKRSLLKLLA